MKRHADVIDRREHDDLTATRWVQPADDIHRPLRVHGSIEADHDPAHISLTTSNDQDGARGASNDPSRDAPHCRNLCHGDLLLVSRGYRYRRRDEHPWSTPPQPFLYLHDRKDYDG